MGLGGVGWGGVGEGEWEAGAALQQRGRGWRPRQPSGRALAGEPPTQLPLLRGLLSLASSPDELCAHSQVMIDIGKCARSTAFLPQVGSPWWRGLPGAATGPVLPLPLPRRCYCHDHYLSRCCCCPPTCEQPTSSRRLSPCKRWQTSAAACLSQRGATPTRKRVRRG